MKTFIFDYDDTLATTQNLYSYTIIDFQRYVIDKIGHGAPDPHTIVNIHTKIDVEITRTSGMAMERFPASFVEAFKQICKNRNYSYTEQELQEVYDMGMRAFDIKPGLVDGAEDVLNFLTEQGDELLLYTKGDQKLQQKKIDMNQLQRWFAPENIHITVDKNSRDLERRVGERDKDITYNVGNSIRSDVNPALEIGLKVIYIPNETWALERDHNGIDESNPRIFVFDKIRDIMTNYKKLGKRIFTICPVRNITEEEKKFLQNYISELESEGNIVHFPPRDTNQDNPIGLNICTENRQGIRNADEVHIYWNSTSSGSKFDFGMTFMAEKPIVLFNKDKIQRTSHKSFENVLLELDAK